MKSTINILTNLFESWVNEKTVSVEKIPQAGSDRKYFRLKSETKTAIGVYSPIAEETEAFISFTNHFLKNNFPVPEFYAIDTLSGCYIISDFGDTSLLDIRLQDADKLTVTAQLETYYKKAITDLIKFQVLANTNFDYSKCFPTQEFGATAIKWDLNYFKYYFLKAFNINFNEELLEKDFDFLTTFLIDVDNQYFMYRDFQARNILVQNDNLYYIDYQGGRKGPLQYDLVSLLYQVKAELPADFRNNMLQHYLKEIKQYLNINETEFIEKYNYFVLLRTLQTLGAYGFRGYFEKKAHFIQSLPIAVNNIKDVIDNKHINKNKLPELFRCLEDISKMSVQFSHLTDFKGLTVEINSFSYKNRIPTDFSGNGGGFVFDCRALPNPGRLPEYRDFTGKDQCVIDFLEKENEVAIFFDKTFQIIKNQIDVYLKRNFKNLQINFGCTGGQHRSVYLAEKTAEKLANIDNVKVVLRHCEQDKEKYII